MEGVYISEKSKYYFRDKNLIRVKNGRETNWGEVIYASKESISKFLKKYRISKEGKKQLEFKIGNKLLDELRNESMKLNEIGGRFVSLIKRSNYYAIYYSSRITTIRPGEIANDSDTEFLIDA